MVHEFFLEFPDTHTHKSFRISCLFVQNHENTKMCKTPSNDPHIWPTWEFSHPDICAYLPTFNFSVAAKLTVSHCTHSKHYTIILARTAVKVYFCTKRVTDVLFFAYMCTYFLCKPKCSSFVIFRFRLFYFCHRYKQKRTNAYSFIID